MDSDFFMESILAHLSRPRRSLTPLPPERTSDGMPTRGGSSKARHRRPEGIPTFDVEHIHNPASGDEICKVVRFREKTLDSVTRFRQVCFLAPDGIPCRIPKEGSAWLLRVFWDDILGKVDRREMISLAPSYLTSHNWVLCMPLKGSVLYSLRTEVGTRFVTEADPIMAKIGCTILLSPKPRLGVRNPTQRHRNYVASRHTPPSSTELPKPLVPGPLLFAPPQVSTARIPPSPSLDPPATRSWTSTGAQAS
ncbi:hypothetical protein CORC01_10274 [Colletotrichum orchidophilum]|uniref:Uncharacterized protein n=1 Tax=Colletotrichum orchidophilum TaxID=1209926 RepID=A0A1G4AZE0_9PEZI|nr:uncharacterized protein CORC01_10274 [Colletotrichum orchidophilum]OHE94455.1 hypothetical protein CORC01_10274 [Colletotrichum orchidophilum]